MRPTKDVRPARLRLVLPEGLPFPLEGALEVDVGAAGGAPAHGGH